MQINQCPRCSARFRGELERCPIDGQPLRRVDDPLIGRTIAGRYLVEELVGSGGMGAVYRGRHQVIDRDVAVKFLNPRFTRDPKQRTRFLGEARAANQINHEHIINITDFGETDDGYVYLVMEYLVGHALAQEIERGPMPANRALNIAMQTAMGLARAHELDVIHRDVKPGNIYLVRRRRAHDLVKLLDFGIARFEREMRITDQGALLGTPEYMAPEMMRQGEIGPATDLYALGCVLYEMLSGRPPFEGQMASVLVKQVSEAPRPLAQFVPELPDGVDEIVLRLLNKKPDGRHRDAHHLVDELKALCATLPFPYPTEEPPGSHSHSDAPAGRSDAPPRRSDAPAAGRGTASQPAPRTSLSAEKPTMYGESEEQGWRTRLQMYRQSAERLFAGRGLPADVRNGLARMQALLDEAAGMRQELGELASEATTQADEVAAVRERIGRALGELAEDESKAARRLEGLRHTLDDCYTRAEASADQLCETGEGGLRMPQAGHLMAGDHVREIRELVARVRGFAERRREVSRIKAEVEAEHNAWEDLCFQMQQLKGRLGTLNASSGAELDAASTRANRIDAAMRERLDALLPEAERVAGALRLADEGRAG